MGRFLNPGNGAFQIALNSEIYVDKTGLIEYTNKVIDTNRALICNSRPRRFGKSTTADMLVAYYSKGCDSEKLFCNLQISKNEDFMEYLNKNDVIYFDVQWCMNSAQGVDKAVSFIENGILEELKMVYLEILSDFSGSLPDALSRIHAATGNKFIVIIDEWDVLIRDEAANRAVQDEYINFLRGIFKGTEPMKYLHLAYLTGILPIKKVKTQSALNNFEEYTMLDASVFAPYIGFTEEEVRNLCLKYHKDFAETERWYDGYLLEGISVYNPKAVFSLMTRGTFQSYWSQTGTYEAILPLINMNFDGLKTEIIKMLAGEKVPVKTATYQNDMVTFRNKDDVLTLLIHLGYLAYDSRKRIAFVPNEEIRCELTNAVEEGQWNEFVELQMQSDELLRATLVGDEECVAQIIEQFHMDYTSVLAYNNENSLSSVISIAYLAAMQYYFKPVREMPTGRGFADLIFIPKKEYTEMPALLVELKWNKSAQTAIDQIKEKEYVRAVENYTGKILMIGINYDKQSKKHECSIEQYDATN